MGNAYKKHKGAQENAWGDGNVLHQVMVAVTQLHIFISTHQAVHLKLVNF